MTSRLAIFPGSFDPPTNGHVDLLHRATALFDDVVIALGRHPTRSPLFSVEERLELLALVAAPIPRVRVGSFEGLLVDYAAALRARAIVRGLRTGADFDYERPPAQANRSMSPAVDTIFLAAAPEHGFVSASLVREIASNGGPVAGLVPAPVAEALARRFPPKKVSP